MEYDSQDVIRETMRLTRENNRLLKKIHRASVWGFWFRLLSFLILIGVPIFLYRYYLGDYIDSFLNMYGSAQEELQNLKNIKEDPRLAPFLQSGQ
jgi:hypothetical protein